MNISSLKLEMSCRKPAKTRPLLLSSKTEALDNSAKRFVECYSLGRRRASKIARRKPSQEEVTNFWSKMQDNRQASP